MQAALLLSQDGEIDTHVDKSPPHEESIKQVAGSAKLVQVQARSLESKQLG
jgi:hypothetical protein